MSKENVAKEYFEKYIKDFEKRIGKNLTTEFNEHLKVLLSRAEKQQKEIERLNFENHMVKKWNEQLDKNCISKDKIREKIKHYNDELEHIKNGEEFENEKPMYYWGKVALEDLLEEN